MDIWVADLVGYQKKKKGMELGEDMLGLFWETNLWTQ